MQTRIGNLTLSVEITEHDFEPEYLGEYQARIESDDLSRLQGWILRQFNGLGDAVDSNLLDEDDGIDPESGCVNGADTLIAALAALGSLSVPSEATIHVEASAHHGGFWIAHDIGHAIYAHFEVQDCMVIGPAELSREQEDEANVWALVDGTRAGFHAGYQAAAAMADAHPEFEERFGSPSLAIGQVLQRIL